MRPSGKAWVALIVGVVLWDVLCEPGEMMSEASARYAKAHPVMAYLVIGSVAAHLVDRIPKRVDPIHWIGVTLRKLKTCA